MTAVLVLAAVGRAEPSPEPKDKEGVLVWIAPVPTLALGVASAFGDYHVLDVAFGAGYRLRPRVRPFVEISAALGQDGCTANAGFCRPFNVEALTAGVKIPLGSLDGRAVWFVAPRLTGVVGHQGRFDLGPYTADPVTIDELSLGLDVGCELTWPTRHLVLEPLLGVGIGRGWGVLGSDGPLWLPFFNVGGRPSRAAWVIDVNLNLLRIGYRF